jgi:Family of unknown function (DUF6493)
MTHSDELQQLLELEHEQEMIPFLQRLTPAERKALIPKIKQQAEYYGEIIEIRANVYSSRMTVIQGNMLAMAAFVCYDQATAQNSNLISRVFNHTLLEKISPWYMAPWFDTLMADLAENERLPGDLTYDVILGLAAQKQLTITVPMVVTRLPLAIFTRARSNRYDTAILFKYPITLSEHIWYLFEYPSNIHFSDRWNAEVNEAYPTEEPNWRGVITRLAGDGTLDRMRLLEETLKTANRSFNKLLSGWFMDLFVSLAPAKAELLQLQPLLMLALDSPQSKVVSTVLNFLKTLTAEETFQYEALLDHLPQIIAADKKSILTTIIQILEKVCKKYPAVQSRICYELCQAFISKEEDIQTKTAKLILQCGDTADHTLKEQLTLFKDSMLAGTQKVLQPFFEGDSARVTEPENTIAPRLPLIGAHNLIPEIQDPNELVFLASQAFENNETYHIDQLPALLIAMQDTITTDLLLQMDPAFQRAYTIFKHLPANAGFLDQRLALFFLNYGKCMADARPEYAEQLNIIKHAKHWWRNRQEIVPLNGWKAFRDEPALYIPHSRLLVLALQKLTDKDTLPLLSTPTHAPCWLDPVVLVQRLQLYEAVKTAPNEFDLQVAIARCALEDTGAAISAAASLPEGELKRLLEFLLHNSALPQGPFNTPSVWMQAGNTKTPLLEYEAFKDFAYNHLPIAFRNGNFSWKVHSRPYEAYGQYNQEKNGYDRYWSEETVMEIMMPEAGEWLLKGSAPLLQEYMNGVRKQLYIGIADIKRLLFLTPNNPSVLLARVMNNCQTYSSYYEVPETNMVSGALQAIHELDIPLNDIIYLFIACCMLHGDKTVRAYAAAYWSSRVPDRINSERLGQMISHLQRIQWAPLKRFCDLVHGSMLSISRQHNEALEAMLTGSLEYFEATPVKDLKKLLEIYSEVLSQNDSRITHPQVASLLSAWQSNSTLKKIATRLQQVVTVAE